VKLRNVVAYAVKYFKKEVKPGERYLECKKCYQAPHLLMRSFLLYNKDMEQKLTGIVMAKKNVGEADRLYSIYTQEIGKVTALAKGVRKSEARLAGSLENLNLVDFSIARTQGTGKISGAILENNFPSLRSSPGALSRAYQDLKLAERIIGLEEKDEEIFSLMFSYLEEMENLSKTGKDKDLASKFEVISLGFTFKLCEVMGYKIDTRSCASCQNKLGEKINFFSGAQGGITCPPCAKGHNGKIFQIKSDSIKLIRIFYKNKLPALYKVSAREDDLGNLREVSVRFADWILR
jgi:DNA repair protein RecO (recombination protein O)